jgi:hypothetical protein
MEVPNGGAVIGRSHFGSLPGGRASRVSRLTHMSLPLGADQPGRYKLAAMLTEAGYGKPIEAPGFRKHCASYQLGWSPA